MIDNGFTVVNRDVTDLNQVKTHYQVPSELSSCHTAVVDGYIIEGHVPVAEVNRLLTEKPAVIGIGVPGMPPGSPGMESPGVEPVPFDVFTFNDTGDTELFASYP